MLVDRLPVARQESVDFFVVDVIRPAPAWGYAPTPKLFSFPLPEMSGFRLPSTGDAIGYGLDGIFDEMGASRTALHSVEAAPNLPPTCRDLMWSAAKRAQ